MQRDDIWVICGASVFILIGAAIMLPGIRNLYRALASAGWPRTAATVITSDRSAEAEHDRDGSSTMYLANIQFRYEVAGHEYTTDVLHFGQTGGSGDSSEVELRRFRYPLGAEVTVVYNPHAPAIAAAEPGFTAEALLLPGAGLAFLVPAIMCIVLYLGMSRGSALFGVGLAMFAGIFAILGCAFLTMGLVNLARAWESQHWPQAPGVIRYGQIDSSTHIDQSADSGPASSTSAGDHIVFGYEVNGKQHYSNVRLFGQVAEQSSLSAHDVALQYPVGKVVSVHYAPGNPDLGVLEPGIQREAYWLPGAGAAFLLFGLAIFIWGIPALTR